MAIRQSEIAIGKKQVPTAFTAGVVVAYRASFTVPAGETIEAGDIVELAVLPADHEFVTATLIPEGEFDGVTAAVGIMTGDVGDKDGDRASGDEVFAAAALDALSSVDTIAPFAIERSDVNRSIGLKFSGTVTGAGQTVTLLVVMTQ